MVTLDGARRIHLIGAGGCSMSGLAQILHSQGHVVTGSDRSESVFTDNLKKQGIPCAIGHSGANVAGADLVVYSAAIKPDNPERVYAAEHGIMQIERSVALGMLSERFHNVVAVAGCHGKTTITSMLAYVNDEAKLDATIHVGGFVELLSGGVRLGSKDLFITEACEYVESFLTLSPTVAIINNIDNDHLDYYRDIDHIVNAFFRFCSLLPPEGLILGCIDDERVEKLLEVVDRRHVSYGLHKGDCHADNITYDENGCPSFDLVYMGESLGRVILHVPGTHNVVNAIAVYLASRQFGVSFGDYAKAMSRFINTQRRFQLLGERGGVKIYHDYAHHPGEIAATLEAASRVSHKKLYCVFQCNSYTRAKTLFCDNVHCFEHADVVLVPDIYPGREVDTGMVHARDMVAAINEQGEKAIYLENFERIRKYLDSHLESGDIVITLGSGDVFTQSQKLL